MFTLFYRMLPLIISLSLLLSIEPVLAQQEFSPSLIHERKALIIGNSIYPTSPLKNPTNDANDIAKLLRELGFQVKVALDVNLKEMERAIDQFIMNLQPGNIALFYFAGHGIQLDGENYLIPVDFVLKDEADAKYSSYSASRLLDRMERANTRLNMIILDACRNNPFLPSRSTPRGLAIMTTGQGTLQGTYIAFATSPGKTASDNSLKRNGLFTGYLIETLKESSLNLDQIFSKVREKVALASNRNQVPWTASSVIGEFYFNLPKASNSLLPITEAHTDKVDETQRTEARTITINGTGHITGLNGRLAPILDSLNRTYLYADNIAIESGKNQPVYFSLNQPFIVEDSMGNRFELKVLSITKNSSVIGYKQLTSGGDNQRATLSVKAMDQNSQPIRGAQLFVIFSDGTYLQGSTDSEGKARIANLKHRIVTIYCAHQSYSAFYQEKYDASSDLVINLKAVPGKGSVIINTTGYIRGLDGRLSPILDTLNRMYLYADNISIENGKNQPVYFRLNEPFQVEDSKGKRFELKIIAIIASSSLIEFTRLN
jgi:hypothetical protein